MNSVVYHFTNTLHLPWIVASGELRPSTIGQPDEHCYLWATTNPEGDRTAYAFIDHSRQLWCRGQLQIVRFTLPSSAFIPWNRIKKTWDPETAAHFEAFAQVGFNERGFSKWRLRREPLPFAEVLRIDVRAHGWPWQRFKPTRENCFEIPGEDGDDPSIMGVHINGFDFYSKKKLTPGYYMVPDRDELREMHENSL